jgi:hypothetical protein
LSTDFEQLKKEFKSQGAFSREELLHFYRKQEPGLKETTFRWRIHNLKEKKIIRSISKNEFSLSYKPNFIPNITNRQSEIYSKLKKQFPFIRCCIWSTTFINEFMLHLPGRFLMLIEVDNDATESVFHFLNDLNIKNVFLQPQEKEIEKYIFENTESVIVKSLITKAPIQKIKKNEVPALEKILVDLYCDRKLFNMFQGSELIHIFNNALNHYAVDITTLLHYAGRRGKADDLCIFLTDKTEYKKITQ